MKKNILAVLVGIVCIRGMYLEHKVKQQAYNMEEAKRTERMAEQTLAGMLERNMLLTRQLEFSTDESWPYHPKLKWETGPSASKPSYIHERY